MPPKPRPPKKGSKADLELKAAKEAKKASSKDNLASLVDDDDDAEGTVFNLGKMKEAVSDEGRVASGTLVQPGNWREPVSPYDFAARSGGTGFRWCLTE